jgi:hypothetical protein
VLDSDFSSGIPQDKAIRVPQGSTKGRAERTDAIVCLLFLNQQLHRLDSRALAKSMKMQNTLIDFDESGFMTTASFGVRLIAAGKVDR